MGDNSLEILEHVLSQQRAELAPELTDQEYFEVFCAEQILKDHDLSFEEIQSGIVDGEHDGGIDAVYTFVNGELVYEDFDTSPFRRDVKIELHIIQSKTSGGFSEQPLERLVSVTRNLLKLGADFSILSQYNDAVKANIDHFRNVYKKLAARFPSLSIYYYYASKRSDGNVHPNTSLKAEELRQECLSLFPDAAVKVNFLGAHALLSMARRQPKTTYQLKVNKSLSAENGYIVLSHLSEYNRFLRDEDGAVRTVLFESNVRDFQGSTEVNEDIGRTLRSDFSVDFWWMNNGVTILASRATLNGDIISIESPQIVNGLQTSTQIARYFGENQKSTDTRNVMVKIVSSEVEDTRDKIIKATNSQNAVQPATLRATDKIQRDIEAGLKSSGLFYDRRKNHYKNEGKQADKIISIPLMAQAVMSMILAKPDTARARPSSLIKDNSVYSLVFSENYPINLYSVAAHSIRSVDRVMKKHQKLSASDRSNLRFYVLFWVASVLTGKDAPNASDVSKIDYRKVDDAIIESALSEVLQAYETLGGGDQVAKGPELKAKLRQRLSLLQSS